MRQYRPVKTLERKFARTFQFGQRFDRRVDFGIDQDLAAFGLAA